MRMFFSKTKKQKRAFSIQEATVALTLLTIVTSVYMNFFKQTNLKNKLRISQDRVDDVEKALESYFSTNKRLPCPADPTLGINDPNFGTEYLDSTGTGCAGDFIGNGTTAKVKPIMNQSFDGTTSNSNLTNSSSQIKHHYILFGAVPVKTLGLSAEKAIDENNNLFTYSVPESLANYNRHSNSIYKNTKLGQFNVYDQTSFNSTTKDIRNQGSTCNYNNFVGIFYNNAGTDDYEKFKRVFNSCGYTMNGNASNFAYVIVKHNKYGDGAWTKYGKEKKPENASKNSYFYYRSGGIGNYSFNNSNTTSKISFDDVQSATAFDKKESIRSRSVPDLITRTSSQNAVYCHPTTFPEYFNNYSCTSSSCNTTSMPFGLKDVSFIVNSKTGFCSSGGAWTDSQSGGVQPSTSSGSYSGNIVDGSQIGFASYTLPYGNDITTTLTTYQPTGLKVSYTPKSTTSKLLIDANFEAACVGNQSSSGCAYALFKDGVILNTASNYDAFIFNSQYGNTGWYDKLSISSTINNTSTSTSVYEIYQKVHSAPNTSGNANISPNFGTNSITVKEIASGVSELQQKYYTNRNRIINGDMRIDQRNGGKSVTPGYSYTLDRWASYNSQAGKVVVQQNANSIQPPVGFSNYLGVISQSSYPIGTNDYFFLQQPIEGYNVADLGWGVANAKPVTLSFWVYSSLTGTFGGTLTNQVASRCYPFSYTISSANTWEYKTIIIPGDTTGVWFTNNSVGIAVNFSLGVGSAQSGTAGAWTTNNVLTANGSVSVVGTAGAKFYITGVQLEKGSTATEFEFRPYDDELRRCQRYYETGTASAEGYQEVNAPINIGAYFLVSKRAAPTMSFGTFTNWHKARVGETRGSYLNGYFRYCLANSTGQVTATEIYYADAEL